MQKGVQTAFLHSRDQHGHLLPDLDQMQPTASYTARPVSSAAHSMLPASYILNRLLYITTVYSWHSTGQCRHNAPDAVHCPLLRQVASSFSHMLNLHNLTEEVANTQTERAGRMGEVSHQQHSW